MLRSCKEFKINNTIKRDVARAIKKEIKDKEYSELSVMYNTENDSFYIVTDSLKVEKLEYEGYIFYKPFTYYKTSKSPTLKDIEKSIFS